MFGHSVTAFILTGGKTMTLQRYVRNAREIASGADPDQTAPVGAV